MGSTLPPANEALVIEYALLSLNYYLCLQTTDLPTTMNYSVPSMNSETLVPSSHGLEMCNLTQLGTLVGQPVFYAINIPTPSQRKYHSTVNKSSEL